MPIHYKGKVIERGDIRYSASNDTNIYTITFDLRITFPTHNGVLYKAPLEIKITDLVSKLRDSYLVDYGDDSPVFVDIANRFDDIYHEYTSDTEVKEFSLKIVSANIEPKLDERIIDAILEENGMDLPYKIYIRRGV